MKRPLLLRVTPYRIRQTLFYRVFAPRASRFTLLYENARLAFAPTVRLQLEPTDVSHQSIALTGVYELAVSRRIAAQARAGGLLVDVGANYGYYTCMWAAARPENRVIAFEPFPANASALRSNVERNGLADRVTVEQLGVARVPGVGAFHAGTPGQTGQGGLSGRGEPAELQVEVCSLDTYFRAQGDVTIDVLKIDVEGADALVLQGAEDLLSRNRIRHVFFEEFPDRMRALNVADETARVLLERHGYRLQRVGSDQWYASLRD